MFLSIALAHTHSFTNSLSHVLPRRTWFQNPPHIHSFNSWISSFSQDLEVLSEVAVVLLLVTSMTDCSQAFHVCPHTHSTQTVSPVLGLLSTMRLTFVDLGQKHMVTNGLALMPLAAESRSQSPDDWDMSCHNSRRTSDLRSHLQFHSGTNETCQAQDNNSVHVLMTPSLTVTCFHDQHSLPESSSSIYAKRGF
mmetsp:Transcript_3817/g.8623  ORF Transcript_3817/g.8623 Transcript_3817/m.8623 type:complete len:194 (+) Transcript_3817:372-953(+)